MAVDEDMSDADTGVSINAKGKEEGVQARVKKISSMLIVILTPRWSGMKSYSSNRGTWIPFRRYPILGS